MKRLISGAILFAALMVISSCATDPTSDLRNGITGLVADPTKLFIALGETKSVIVRAYDEQGQPIAEHFDVTQADAGLAVRRDTTFRQIFRNEELVLPSKDTEFQFNVTANELVGGTFTISAGGKSTVVEVEVLPVSFDIGELSATSAAIGDTLSITLPAPYVFTPASVVSLDGGPAITVPLLANSSTIRFLPGPNADGKVTVSNVIISFSPTLGPYTVTSRRDLTMPLVTSVVGTFSDNTPALGDTVTFTATGLAKLLPGVELVFGAAPAVIISQSVDSTAVSFVPYPLGAGPLAATVDSAIVGGAFKLELSTSATLTEPSGFAGTSTRASAPTIAFPAAGGSSTIVDAGTYAGTSDCTAIALVGAPCRIYRVDVASPLTAVTFTATWANTADIGVYFTDAAGVDVFGDFGCDAHGSGATAQPETCTYDFAAGTYFMTAINFSAAGPAFIRYDISTAP